MILIGNDLVDLVEAARPVGAAATPKHRDARFMNRVFTSAERAAISRAADPERALWSIWAAKEAAFKIARKTDPKAVFAHSRYEVDAQALTALGSRRSALRGGCRGAVSGPGLRATAQWVFEEGQVHCVALLRETGALRVRPRIVARAIILGGAASLAGHKAAKPEESDSVHSRESRLVRLFARHVAARELGIERAERLSVVRPEVASQSSGFGPPELRLDGQRLDGVDLSLSHDGAWLAVALAFTG